MARVLILGGTGEARRLADRLAEHDAIEVITSLAGRTRAPALPAGTLRVGGFGGAEGLAAYLGEAAIDAVVDATHPFAARISANAVAACAATATPRLALVRPPWAPRAGDRWLDVADAAAAAALLPARGRRAFLTLGRQGLAPFAGCRDTTFIVRLVEAAPLPLAGATVIVARGPFALADERALLARHRIDVVVAKNAGGDDAKIAAARQAGLPVIMLARPPPPEGERVARIDDAVGWSQRALRAPSSM